MNLLPLFLILQSNTVWSQGAAPTVSLIPPPVTVSDTTSSVTNASSTPLSTTTGTTNSSTATSTAQFPSLSGVSSCVSTCLAQGSARLNCTSVVDVNCFCVKSNYPAEIVDCGLAMCPSEVPTIESFGQQFCNIASAHPTLSFMSIPTSSSSATSPSSTSVSTSSVTTTPTPTPTSGATVPWKPIYVGASTGLMGLGIVFLVGVILCV